MRFVIAALLREDIVRGIVLLNFLDNERLGLLVDLGDKICLLSELPFDMLHFSEIVLEEFSRFERGFPGNVEH